MTLGRDSSENYRDNHFFMLKLFGKFSDRIYFYVRKKIGDKKMDDGPANLNIKDLI